MSLQEDQRYLNGNHTDYLWSPERKKASLVVATDVEGPHLLGDTALNTISSFVRLPEYPSNGVDYGGTLYQETYNWFEENFDKKGFGQEGSDIILALPLLLFSKVTGGMIRQEADKSLRTPGSENYIAYLKKQGATVIGVTTAWKQPHEEIGLKKIGLDGIVGTDFPIDEARERLARSGKWQEEMHQVGRFLYDSFAIIKAMSHAEGERAELLRKKIHGVIGQFYLGILGVSWDGTGKQVIRNGHPTELAKIMVQCDVIGDRRKAEVANKMFLEHGQQGATHLAIGDGFNDRRMLAQSPWSIGINGADAAKAAKIGVISLEVGTPLIVITELIKKNPTPIDSNIQTVVEDARRILGETAVVHLGGGSMSEDLVRRHKIAKKEIRGKGALLP